MSVRGIRIINMLQTDESQRIAQAVDIITSGGTMRV